MLQVNGRSVDLDKGQATNELVCYTAENPFHVRLIGPNRRPEMEGHFARKRVKSPLQNAGKSGESSPKKRRLTTRWEAKAKVSCSPNAADQSGIQRMNANGKLTRGHLGSDSSNCCDFSSGFVGRMGCDA